MSVVSLTAARGEDREENKSIQTEKLEFMCARSRCKNISEIILYDFTYIFNHTVYTINEFLPNDVKFN